MSIEKLGRKQIAVLKYLAQNQSFKTISEIRIALELNHLQLASNPVKSLQKLELIEQKDHILSKKLKKVFKYGLSDIGVYFLFFSPEIISYNQIAPIYFQDPMIKEVIIVAKSIEVVFGKEFSEELRKRILKAIAPNPKRKSDVSESFFMAKAAIEYQFHKYKVKEKQLKLLWKECEKNGLNTDFITKMAPKNITPFVLFKQ
jgi:hypothetical protein